MIADRLLAGLRERLGFVPTTWSLVRIAGFTIAGLRDRIPGRSGPTGQPRDRAVQPGLSDAHHAQRLACPFGDTRGFKPTSRPGKFQVAWIGGSETLAVGRGHRAFIPRLVTDRVGTVDGRRVSTDVYFLNAIRLTDELAALSAAVAEKPDLLVISLNPVWVLNDLAPQQWGYLDGTLARHSLWPPSRWPVAASLVSPGDVGWKALSRVSPSPVGDRYEWGVDLAEKTSGLTFLDDVEDVTTPAPTGLERLAAASAGRLLLSVLRTVLERHQPPRDPVRHPRARGDPRRPRSTARCCRRCSRWSGVRASTPTSTCLRSTPTCTPTRPRRRTSTNAPDACSLDDPGPDQRPGPLRPAGPSGPRTADGLRGPHPRARWRPEADVLAQDLCALLDRIGARDRMRGVMTHQQRQRGPAGRTARVRRRRGPCGSSSSSPWVSGSPLVLIIVAWASSNAIRFVYGGY